MRLKDIDKLRDAIGHYEELATHDDGFINPFTKRRIRSCKAILKREDAARLKRAVNKIANQTSSHKQPEPTD